MIRPPSEADSLILQVAVGCPHNHCRFCGAYRNVQYRRRSLASVLSQIESATNHSSLPGRVFLADGDVMALSDGELKELFELIRSKLPSVRRISLYGSSYSVNKKSFETLQLLKKYGLDRVYMGVESGDDELLKKVGKKSTASTLVHASEMVRRAGIFLSVTLLLGLGGRTGSERHSRKSGELLNRMKPNQVALLTLMLLENTEMHREWKQGKFTPLSPEETLHELYEILDRIDFRCQFHANHASSYLPLSGRLPKDKSRLLQMIREGWSGVRPLVPEYWRSL